MPSSPSKDVVAIVAALPREIAALVRGVPPDAALLRRGVHLYRLQGAVVVAAGMGAERAALGVQAALAAAKVSTLISAGLAGACTPALSPGAVAHAADVIDSRTGERFEGLAHEGGVVAGWTLVTAPRIASVQEKARLAASYGAAMVDMEAAAVGRLAAMHGLGFRAIKGISDAHDFELASLARFAGKHGSFRTAAFALHTALHPRQWSKAARLGRDSSRALAALTAALREIAAGAS
jgi:adenosylhomocysteine nucleosidase